MVNVNTLQPGDTVQIVHKWPGNVGQNSRGHMDVWLGKVMTVSDVGVIGNFTHGHEACVRMEEDSRWVWTSSMIEHIVSRISEHVLSPIDDTDLAMLFA